MTHIITNYPSGDPFDPANPSSTEVQQISPTDDCNAGVVALFNSVKNLSDNKANATYSYLTFTINGTPTAENWDLTPHIPLYASGTFVDLQVVVKTAPGSGGVAFVIGLNGQQLSAISLNQGQTQATGHTAFTPSTFQSGDYLSIGCSGNNGAADATVVIVVQYS
jgi:hypothetical protein